jgi:hypothetical protein
MIPIQELVPGHACGCDEFSNRGLGPEYNEVTVWPKTIRYHLTTGEGDNRLLIPRPVELNSAEKQICAILGLREWELGTFLRSWEPGAPGSGCDLWDGGMLRRPTTLDEFEKALFLTGKTDKHDKLKYRTNKKKGLDTEP